LSAFQRNPARPPSISPTLLAQRLRLLERNGIVERRPLDQGRPERWLPEMVRLFPRWFEFSPFAKKTRGAEPGAETLLDVGNASDQAVGSSQCVL
jgi:hypothetical protein